MPQPTNLVFTYKEIARVLVKEARLTDGHWGLFFKFGLAGTNIGPSNDDLKPAAIVAIMDIGLQRFEMPTNLTVDAADVGKEGQ